MTVPGTEPSPGRVARLRAQAAAARDQVEAARRSIPLVDAVFVMRGRDTNVGGNLMACAIAYRLFAWLLPVSLVIAAGLGFLDAAQRDPADVARGIGLGAYVASSVNQAAAQAESSRWIILLLGLWGLYVASGAAARTFIAISCLVWGMPLERPRSSLKAAGAFAGAALVVLLVAAGAHWARHRSPGLGLGVTVAVVVVIAAVLLGTSLLLPHGDAPWVRLLPGAVFGAVGIQALHVFTVVYLGKRVASASELYGALGAAAAVLLWLYLLGRIAIGSAVVNATLWERSRTPAESTTPEG